MFLNEVLTEVFPQNCHHLNQVYSFFYIKLNIIERGREVLITYVTS